MKTNTISLISVRIRFVYIPAAAAEGEPWWAAAAWVHGPSDSMVESGGLYRASLCSLSFLAFHLFWFSSSFQPMAAMATTACNYWRLNYVPAISMLGVSYPWQQWQQLHLIADALCTSHLHVRCILGQGRAVIFPQMITPSCCSRTTMTQAGCAGPVNFPPCHSVQKRKKRY